MLVVLSGPLASGKTVLAKGIANNFNVRHVRIREAIAELAGVDGGDRAALLRAGAALEANSSGAWLADYVNGQSMLYQHIVVDAVRTQPQLRSVKGDRDTQIHITANAAVRSARYLANGLGDVHSKEAAFAHPTELGADELRTSAELVIDTSALTTDDALEIAAIFLKRLFLAIPDESE